MEKKKNVHEGHRLRIDEKVKSLGLHNMPQHEQLEYMLYQIIPLGNTNEMAHDLLQKFGSLGQIFNASERELATVKGIGSRSAKFILQIPVIAGIYQRAAMENPVILDTIEKIGEYATTLFNGMLTEEVYVISLTVNNRLIRHDRISAGGVSSAPIYIRDIIEICISSKAYSIILAHNHPSGELLPSNDDIIITKKVAAALAAMDIKLADHIIAAGNKYISLNKSGVV